MALSNTQYDTLMRRYEARQLENQHIVAERINALYPKFPRLAEIDAAISSHSVAQAKKFIEGDESALPQLNKDLSALAAERREVLKSHGYPENYFDPPYQCPDCKDTGYIGREKCHCFRQKEIRLLYAQSNIQDLIQSENFSTLSYEYYQQEDLKHFESAVQLCKNFAENFKQDYRNLFFYGTVGTGKSFLSGCIAKELLEQGRSVIYFSASGLFDTLARYSFDIRAKESLQDFYEDLYNCEIFKDSGFDNSHLFWTAHGLPLTEDGEDILFTYADGWDLSELHENIREAIREHCIVFDGNK